jgi:hypothetical protein
MKFIITFILLVFLPFINSAQGIKFKKNWQADPSDNTFAANRFFIQFDYSANNLYKKQWTPFDSYGAYKSGGLGPASAKLEYSFSHKLGALMGATFFKGDANWRVSEMDSNQNALLYNKGFTYQSLTYFVGLNVHVFTSHVADLYLGGHFGYTTIHYKPYSSLWYKNNNEMPKATTPWYYNAYFGLRINYSTRGGFYLEAGQSAISNLCIGTIYRFGL